MGSISIQIIPHHMGMKIFLHFLMIMLRLQVVIYPGVSELYVRNDFHTVSDITRCLSIRNSYEISVGKEIFKDTFETKILY
jgi:hypothetical protein